MAVGSDFLAHIDDAISRFAYLHPAIEIEIGPNVISLFADSLEKVDDLVRDLHFALYRQKIYAESLPLRKRIIEGVMGR